MEEGSNRGKGKNKAFGSAELSEKPMERVGGDRNVHGTRRRRRVICSTCGAEDHVDAMPQDLSRVLCRKCAEEILNIYDEGREVRDPPISARCGQCGRDFVVPDLSEPKGGWVCWDCHKGLLTFSGRPTDTTDIRRNRSLEKRRSGVMLRSRKGKKGE